MIKIVKQGGTYNSPIHELVMDSSSEVADLPVNIPVGSTAYAIDTGDTYMLNSTGEWNLMSSKGGSGESQSYEIASQEEAEIGVDNTKVMSPLRVKQAIEKNLLKAPLYNYSIEYDIHYEDLILRIDFMEETEYKFLSIFSTSFSGGNMFDIELNIDLESRPSDGFEVEVVMQKYMPPERSEPMRDTIILTLVFSKEALTEETGLEEVYMSQIAYPLPEPRLGEYIILETDDVDYRTKNITGVLIRDFSFFESRYDTLEIDWVSLSLIHDVTISYFPPWGYAIVNFDPIEVPLQRTTREILVRLSNSELSEEANEGISYMKFFTMPAAVEPL